MKTSKHSLASLLMRQWILIDKLNLYPQRVRHGLREPILRQDDRVLLGIDAKVYAYLYVMAALRLVS